MPAATRGCLPAGCKNMIVQYTTVVWYFGTTHLRHRDDLVVSGEHGRPTSTGDGFEVGKKTAC